MCESELPSQMTMTPRRRLLASCAVRLYTYMMICDIYTHMMICDCVSRLIREPQMDVYLRICMYVATDYDCLYVEMIGLNTCANDGVSFCIR